MYLEGEHISPVDVKTGMFLRYLRRCDIDRSGRGYFSPCFGWVEEKYRKHIIFDNGETIAYSDFKEIVVVKKNKYTRGN